MFDCTIIVKGNGKGDYGRFKEDKTDKVLRFMVDNTYLYTAVKQHVVKCPECDPTEALRHYLNRRLTLDKFQPQPGKTWPIAGMVTGSLAKLALSYERMCAKTRPIPKELVNEFIWRSADHDLIHANEHRLSVREIVGAAELFLKIHGGLGNAGARQSANEATMLEKVCKLLQHHARPETAEEMEDLIQIMETMCT
jgi:hypothetical protein